MFKLLFWGIALYFIYTRWFKPKFLRAPKDDQEYIDYDQEYVDYEEVDSL